MPHHQRLLDPYNSDTAIATRKRMVTKVANKSASRMREERKAAPCMVWTRPSPEVAAQLMAREAKKPEQILVNSGGHVYPTDRVRHRPDVDDFVPLPTHVITDDAETAREIADPLMPTNDYAGAINNAIRGTA